MGLDERRTVGGPPLGGVWKTGVGELVLKGVLSPGNNFGKCSDGPLKVFEVVLLQLEAGELEGRGASKHRAKSVRGGEKGTLSSHVV